MDGMYRVGSVNPFANTKPLEQLQLPLEDPHSVWWETVKPVPGWRRGEIMALFCMLQKRGVPVDAITEMAIDYARRHALIRNPYAYYSQFGPASTAAKVKAALAEHERVKEKR